MTDFTARLRVITDNLAVYFADVIRDAKRDQPPEPPKYRCTEVWLDRHQSGGHQIIRGTPAGGPKWRRGLNGVPRPPTADEIASDLRVGPEIGRYWQPESGAKGVTIPGRYAQYTDRDGRVVARFLQNSPVSGKDERAEEAAWLASGQPVLIPADVPGPMIEIPEPAAPQEEPFITGREEAEAWLASRNGGKPAPLEPPTEPFEQPVSDDGNQAAATASSADATLAGGEDVSSSRVAAAPETPDTW